MGIPKFFRYISERYPCLSDVVRENDIPEFDNLYLDMNGIIHNCSHPNDEDPLFRITEEKIFQDICYYIETLFRIIQPKKLFFMAVDGVAPRAKMNQQRGRRFRAAQDAAMAERAALAKGKKLPSTDRFDSNCITPGTPFMVRLQEQLKFFVARKISTDRLWQNVKVILSGHETPGEGEHKIMDYIRYMKSRDGYDANTRHCLYGLDADLIMLGLCTHEPHFSLLREEVKFSRQKNPSISNNPEKITFYLLHLSLMREYLEMEFKDIHSLPFGFDIEKVIDDWVLMCFLVGNDFIPHLPNLHIHQDALPALYKVYCQVLPTMDGYMNEGGTLNLSRFQKFMEKLAKLDLQHHENTLEEAAMMAQKRGRNAPRHKNAQFEKNFADVSTEAYRHQLCDDMMDFLKNDKVCNSNEADSSSSPSEMDDLSAYFERGDENDRRTADQFVNHKIGYYANKMNYGVVDQSVMEEQALGYIKAIQWNLNYYYNGVCSWCWYYPHHFAPYISDIQKFSDCKLTFEYGKPFLPFEQLLAVLPSLSKHLLPVPFQDLMTNPKSPLKDYYPLDFKTDLNGKKNDWEAVVLIPFIDEKLLLSTMKSCYSKLTDEERRRNKHGPMLVYKYTPENLGPLEGPAYCATLTENHAKVQQLPRENIVVPRNQLKKGLLPGVTLDVFFPGFPTFKHKQYYGELKVAGVKVFDMPSRSLNMIVHLANSPGQSYTLPKLVPTIGKVVLVGWPFLCQARVSGVSDGQTKWYRVQNELNKETLDDERKKMWKTDAEKFKSSIFKKRGIDCGEIKMLVYVNYLDSTKPVLRRKGTLVLEKQWADWETAYPYQLIVEDVELPEKTKGIKISEYYPVGSVCFCTFPDFYGCIGQVEEMDGGGTHLKVKVMVVEEPHLDHLRQMDDSQTYLTSWAAAKYIGISNQLMARITSTMMVLDANEEELRKSGNRVNRVNVGLKLRSVKRGEYLPGYVQLDESGQWLYSEKAIQLVLSYARRFPEMISYLDSHAEVEDMHAKFQIFQGYEDTMDEKLEEVTAWLNEQPHSKLELRKINSVLLDPAVIITLENTIEGAKQRMRDQTKQVTMRLKINFIAKPLSSLRESVPEYSCTEYQLLDRVVNARDSHVVPLGARGTIIGLEKSQEDDKVVNCDVLFDEEFPNGRKMLTEKNRVYTVAAQSLINVTFHTPGTKKDVLTNVRVQQMETPAAAVRGRHYAPSTSQSQTNQTSSFNMHDKAGYPLMDVSKETSAARNENDGSCPHVHVLHLQNTCVQAGYQPPVYTYLHGPDELIIAQIRLPSGEAVFGPPSSTKDMASEAAASMALDNFRRWENGRKRPAQNEMNDRRNNQANLETNAPRPSEYNPQMTPAQRAAFTPWPTTMYPLASGYTYARPFLYSTSRATVSVPLQPVFSHQIRPVFMAAAPPRIYGAIPQPQPQPLMTVRTIYDGNNLNNGAARTTASFIGTPIIGPLPPNSIKNAFNPQMQQHSQATNAPSAVPMDNSYRAQLTSVPLENSYRVQPMSVPTHNSYQGQQTSVPTDNSYRPQQPAVPADNSYRPQQPAVFADNSYRAQQSAVPTDNSYRPQQPAVPTDNSYRAQQASVTTDSQYRAQLTPASSHAAFAHNATGIGGNTPTPFAATALGQMPTAGVENAQRLDTENFWNSLIARTNAENRASAGASDAGSSLHSMMQTMSVSSDDASMPGETMNHDDAAQHAQQLPDDAPKPRMKRKSRVGANFSMKRKEE